MYKNKSLVIVLSLIIVSTLSLGVLAISENQAPELQKAVEEGEIEPLEERLPKTL